MYAIGIYTLECLLKSLRNSGKVIVSFQFIKRNA